MSIDSVDEQRSVRLRQRLWGAAVLIAIAVIVLPLLLDGAGSESQFRRVERLREEPPVIIDNQAKSQTDPAPQMRAANADGVTDSAPLDIRIGEDDPPDYMKTEEEVRRTIRHNRLVAPLTAWVVQAGSFRDQENATAVRDQLRRAGFPSFVSESDSDEDWYRVHVGPMIDRQLAGKTRDQVISLLGRDAIILSYP